MVSRLCAKLGRLFGILSVVLPLVSSSAAWALDPMEAGEDGGLEAQGDPDSVDPKSEELMLEGEANGSPALGSGEAQGMYKRQLSLAEPRAGQRDGRFSFALAFGSQSSPFGREAAGFLYGFSRRSWLGLFVQAGLNEERGQSAYGSHLEWGYDLVRRDPSALSLLATLAAGVSDDQELIEQETQLGASVGLQLEVELLEAVSTALRVEVGGQFSPAEKMRVSTSSSELLLFYHLN